MIGDWKTGVGNQELPELTGKFDLGIQNETRKRLTTLCQESSPVIANILFQQHMR